MTGRSTFYLGSAIEVRRTPVLSLAAVLSLAIGIGANAAIFSMFTQALLKRLPVQQPEQLTLTTFAKKFHLARDAVVGTRMELGRNDKPKLDIEIMGLVQDSKYSNAKVESPPLFFLPHRQREQIRSINYYVRSSPDAGGVSAAVSRSLERLDPTLPIAELRTMETQVREQSGSDAGRMAIVGIAVGLAGPLVLGGTRRRCCLVSRVWM